MTANQQLAKFADLTWQDLEEWAGSRIVGRGKSYKTHVLNLCLTSEGGLVATVSGTDLYTTRVDRPETGDLLCSCTCPYDWGPCKHGVGVILAALDTLKGKRNLPVAAPDDERLGGRPGITAEGLPYDDRDEIQPRDGDEFPESASAPTPPGGSRRGPKLRGYVSKLSKRELTELVLDLANTIPEVRERLSDRIRLEADGIAAVVDEVRGQIEELAAESAWTDDWSESGHVPDYGQVRERMEAMLAAGHADAVVALGDDLLQLGTDQIEMSDDEGEVAMEISRCMETVARAVLKSSMSPAGQLLWEIDARLRDEYNVLGDAEGPLVHPERYAPDDWSQVADTLAERLETLPTTSGEEAGDRFSSDYWRQRLMRAVVSALERAGRHADTVSLLEREVAVTRCYTDLVDHLLATGRTDDARRWALAGFEATIEDLRGVAWELEERLRKMAEQEGDARLAAAYRALEFFVQEDVGPYAALQEAAQAAGVWEAVRPLVLRFLETGELPEELATPPRKNQQANRVGTPSEWPLPPTDLKWPCDSRRSATFPRAHTLVEVAIHERRYDDVVKWYARADSSHGVLASDLGDEVASAVRRTHPEVALAIWREKAEAWIGHVKRSAYEVAGKYLTRMADLYRDLGRTDEWSAYLRELRAANSRRPRMMEVLDSIGGKRRRILDGKELS